MDVRLIEAEMKDAQAILDGQREAFLPSLERYNDGDLDPANEKLENIQKAIRDEYFYIILADEAFAGSLMIEKDPDPLHLKLHTIYVLPALQNRGIAGRAIDIAERLHSGAVEWKLNTPADLANNRYLYEKKGYVKRGEITVNDFLTLSYYSKAGPAARRYEAAESRDGKQSGIIELRKGQRLIVNEKYEGSEGWDGWHYCTAEGGSGWVHESVIDFDGAIAKTDYSSFELNIMKGEKLKGLRETGGWIWCENSQGERGWVPEDCLKQVK